MVCPKIQNKHDNWYLETIFLDQPPAPLVGPNFQLLGRSCFMAPLHYWRIKSVWESCLPDISLLCASSSTFDSSCHPSAVVIHPQSSDRRCLSLNAIFRNTNMEAAKFKYFALRCQILDNDVLHLYVDLYKKHRKNCECCPGHHLIVDHYSSI